ncbi:MAG TPA: metal-sulfur cluster assembly factor [Vicinamibacterales bacterium]|nr:metal-sulfur cluster assembly factor [Vicinamibacterales bacterium]
MLIHVMTDSDVRESLRTVIDPELGVNIVDLGLVYGIDLAPPRVRVVMTMTSPACPLGEYLTDLIDSTLHWQFREVEAIDVDLVWEPAWHPGMMSADAKRQLGWRDDDHTGDGHERADDSGA